MSAIIITPAGQMITRNSRPARALMLLPTPTYLPLPGSLKLWTSQNSPAANPAASALAHRLGLTAQLFGIAVITATSEDGRPGPLSDRQLGALHALFATISDGELAQHAAACAVAAAWHTHTPARTP